MKRCLKRRAVSLPALLLLGACSSAPTEPKVEIDPLEQTALNAVAIGSAEAPAALDAALARYRSLDHVDGRWRILLLKTKVALASGDMDVALAHAETLEALSELIGSPDVMYQTHLVLGRVRQDASEYGDAMRYASSPIEQALVHAYMGDTAQALSLIDPEAADNPGDRAFIYYKHGISTGSAEHFAKAHTYYRLAEDPRGIADSLVRLARISADTNRDSSARSFAERAIKVLAASGDNERAEAIRRWLNAL
jgi:hypothetical protein